MSEPNHQASPHRFRLEGLRIHYSGSGLPLRLEPTVDTAQGRLRLTFKTPAARNIVASVADRYISSRKGRPTPPIWRMSTCQKSPIPAPTITTWKPAYLN